MLKHFTALSIDWIDCLVDRNLTGEEGWVVWGGVRRTWLELDELASKSGYGAAVPLPYDTEYPQTVDTQYWLQRVWHDPEFFDLNIDWRHCDPSFIAWCNWVNQQWFDAGFCDAVPIPLTWQ